MEIIEVRRLKTKDFFTVASLLGKMAGDASKEISDGATASQIGTIFVSNALKYAEKDIKTWLADLVNIKPEEFDGLAFDAPIEIIEQLAEKEDLLSFLQRVQQLRGKLTKSET
jgi:hypothetical protein